MTDMGKHDDVIKWKHVPRYWPFVLGIHRSPGEFPAQRPVTRSFDVLFYWVNGWINNREAGDLRRYRAHHDVIVMFTINTTTKQNKSWQICIILCKFNESMPLHPALIYVNSRAIYVRCALIFLSENNVIACVYLKHSCLVYFVTSIFETYKQYINELCTQLGFVLFLYGHNMDILPDT